MDCRRFASAKASRGPSRGGRLLPRYCGHCLFVIGWAGRGGGSFGGD